MALHQGSFGRWLSGSPILSKLLGGSRQATPPREQVSYPGSFHIQEIDVVEEAEGTLITWLATAIRETRSAQFGIELLVKPLQADELFNFISGALIRKEDSAESWFLSEISELLGARNGPPNTRPTERLEFTASILGTWRSRHAGPDQVGACFSSDPPGNWMAIKVFVANGEGEFFLNLNPIDGEGEIALKDEDYGDIVVEELAKVFLPNGSPQQAES